jgi:hypothetical protein
MVMVAVEIRRSPAAGANGLRIKSVATKARSLRLIASGQGFLSDRGKQPGPRAAMVPRSRLNAVARLSKVGGGLCFWALPRLFGCVGVVVSG